MFALGLLVVVVFLTAEEATARAVVGAAAVVAASVGGLSDVSETLSGDLGLDVVPF